MRTVGGAATSRPVVDVVGQADTAKAEAKKEFQEVEVGQQRSHTLQGEHQVMSLTLGHGIQVPLVENQAALRSESVASPMGKLSDPERGNGTLVARNLRRDIDGHQLEVESRLAHATGVNVKGLGPLTRDKVSASKGHSSECVGVTVTVEMFF